MKGKPAKSYVRTWRSQFGLWQLAVPITVMGGLIYWSMTGEDEPAGTTPAAEAEHRAMTGVSPDATGAREPAVDPELAPRLIAPAAPPGPDSADEAGAPLRVTRSRYRTLSERCRLGIAESGIRCSTVPRSHRAARAIGVDDADAAPTHSISGRVMTADGFGIGNVSLVASRVETPVANGPGPVTARKPGGYTRYQAVSAIDGSYAFREIPEGSYRIETARHEAFGAIRITANTGVDYADIVLREQQHYLIEGIVSDSAGSPMSHVTVLPVVEGIPSVRSDRYGKYRLPVAVSANAGHLTLRFEAPGFDRLEQTAPLTADFDSSGLLDPVSLQLDVVMQPIELTTNVRGTLKSLRDEPIAGHVVELRPVGRRERYRSVSDRAGEFEFPVIPAPKTYQLRVAGHPDHPDYRADVLVTRQDYQFDVVMEPFAVGTLRGRLVDPDGAAVAGIDLVVRNAASSQANSSVRSDSAGRFVVEDAPAGATLLASEGIPALLIRGIDIRPGGESSVDIVIDSGSHRLFGIVVDRRGLPVPASDVVLKWSHRSVEGITSSVTRSTATDYQGRFAFDRLGPGPHSLVVDAPGYERVEIDHEIRRDGYEVSVRLH